MLVATMVGVWAWTEAQGGSTSFEVLSRMGMRRALWGFSEEPHRLLTSIFLHYGPWHLFSNALSLAVLGTAVELASSAGFLLFVFFLSGLSGAVASLHYSPQAAALGASGAVFGVVGSLLVLIWAHPGGGRRRIIQTALLGTSILLGLRPEILGYAIDTSAHVAGLCAGTAAGLCYVIGRRFRWVLLALLALSLAYVVWQVTSGPRLPF